MNRSKLGTIFAIVFVDLLGFGLVLPLVPFYAKFFGASDTVIGLLVASYAAAQFIGAPLLGRLSDRFGRRPVLLVSIFGTAVGFLMMGFAGSLLMLFASRILDGATGGNITVAQAYITDITDERNRAKGLGLIGAAFGLGFIIGPAVAGLLSAVGANVDGAGQGTIVWQFALPAFVAAGLAFANLVAAYFFLPESLTEEARTKIAARPREEFALRNMTRTFHRPRVGPLLTIRFFSGLGFAMFQTVFPLFAASRLGLGPSGTAFVLAYVGLLIVLVQGVAMGRLTARFSDSWLIYASVVLLTGALLAWAVTPSLAVLMIVLIPLALGGGVLNTVLNSALSKSVYPEEVGGTLGLSAAIESLTRVISPTAGGMLLDYGGTWAPGVTSAVITGALAIYSWNRLIVNPDPPLPSREVLAAAEA